MGWCGMGMTESVPSVLRGSPASSMVGRAPRATGGGCLPGVLCCEAGTNAAGKVHHSHSKAVVSSKLIPEVMSLEGPAVSAGAGGRTGIDGRAFGVVVTSPLTCTPPRATDISFGSQTDSPGAAMSYNGGSP